MQPVDPGDLAQGVGGYEDHHEADGTAGPSVRRTKSVSAQSKGLTPPGPAPSSSLTPCLGERSVQSSQVWPGRPVACPAKPRSPRGGVLHPPWPQEEGPSPIAARPHCSSAQVPRRGHPAKPEVSGHLSAKRREALPGLHLVSFPRALSDTCSGSLEVFLSIFLVPYPQGNSTWQRAVAW